MRNEDSELVSGSNFILTLSDFCVVVIHETKNKAVTLCVSILTENISWTSKCRM